MTNLANILICPQSGERLVRAPKALLQLFNDKIKRGALIDEQGRALKQKLEGAWVTQSGTRAYVIRDGLPIVIVSESVDLHQLGMRVVSPLMK